MIVSSEIFLDLAKKRSSVRKFKETPLPKDVLDKILEAGRVAPTACNNQPQRILVLQSKENLEKLEKAYDRFTSPLALIIYADDEKAWSRKFDGQKSTFIDSTIVTDHMMLCAEDLGVSSVWVCAFNPKILKEEFPAPENYVPVNILYLGYRDTNLADPNRHSKTRKSIDQTVFFEQF